MDGNTKTYLIDGNPVDVQSSDVAVFKTKFPKAIEAQSFIVNGGDTVDVAISDVDNFKGKFPDAKPTFEQPAPVEVQSSFGADMAAATQPKSVMADGTIPLQQPESDQTANSPFQWSGGANSDKNNQSDIFAQRKTIPQAAVNQEVRNELTKRKKGDDIYNSNPEIAQPAIDKYINDLSAKGYTPKQIKQAIDTNKDLEHGLLGGKLKTPPQIQTDADKATFNAIPYAESAANTFSKSFINSFSGILKAPAIVGSYLKNGTSGGAAETPLYKIGENISKYAEELFPENPELQDSFFGKTAPEIAGTLASFAAGGAAGKGLKLAEGLEVGAKGATKLIGEEVAQHLPAVVQAGTSAGASMYEQALQVGKAANEMSKDQFVQQFSQQFGTPEQAAANYDNFHGKDPYESAFTAFKYGMASGSVFAISPANMISKFNTITGGTLAKAGADVLKSGANGMFQFGAMKAIENAGAEETYDVTRKLLDHVVDEGGAGFMMNAFFSGMGHALNAKALMFPKGSVERAVVDKAIDEVDKKAADVGDKEYFEKIVNSPEVQKLVDEKTSIYNSIQNVNSEAAKQVLSTKIDALNKQIDAARKTATDENIDSELNKVYADHNQNTVDELKKDLANPDLDNSAKSAIEEQIKQYTAQAPKIPIEPQPKSEEVELKVGSKGADAVVANPSEQQMGSIPTAPTKSIDSEVKKVSLKYNDKGEHLAPNNKPSLLSEHHAKVVRTPSFKDWFGDWENNPTEASKVVDKNGEPLLVYRGGAVFDKFNPSKGKDKGIYFTDNKDFALWFAHQHDLVGRDKANGDYKGIPEKELESGEPYDEKYLKYGKIHKAFLNIKDPTIINEIDAKAMPINYEDGKDGLIAKVTGDFGYDGAQYVVFDPHQIKEMQNEPTPTESGTPTGDSPNSESPQVQGNGIPIKESETEIKGEKKSEGEKGNVAELKNNISLQNNKKESDGKGETNTNTGTSVGNDSQEGIGRKDSGVNKISNPATEVGNGIRLTGEEYLRDYADNGGGQLSKKVSRDKDAPIIAFHGGSQDVSSYDGYKPKRTFTQTQNFGHILSHDAKSALDFSKTVSKNDGGKPFIYETEITNGDFLHHDQLPTKEQLNKIGTVNGVDFTNWKPEHELSSVFDDVAKTFGDWEKIDWRDDVAKDKAYDESKQSAATALKEKGFIGNKWGDGNNSIYEVYDPSDLKIKTKIEITDANNKGISGNVEVTPELQPQKPIVAETGASVEKAISDFESNKSDYLAKYDNQQRLDEPAKGEGVKGTKPKIKFERNTEKIKDIQAKIDALGQKSMGANMGVKISDAIEAVKLVMQLGYYKAEDIAKYLIEKGYNHLVPHIDEALNHIKEEYDLSDLENPKSTGISIKAREERADELRSHVEKSGQGWTGAEALARGNELLKKGTDPHNMGDLDLHDQVAVSQAYSNKLGEATDLAADTFGEKSKEYEDAKQAELDYAKESKPLATLAHKAFAGFQGQVEINTGSWHGLQRAFKERTGENFTEKQAKEAKELVDKYNNLNTKFEDLKAKYTDAMEKWAAEKKKQDQEPKNIKQRSRELADFIRKGKLSRPDVFSAASPASIVWDGALEIAATTIETGGDIAQAIATGLEYIKNSQWYKDSDKKEQAEQSFKDFLEEKRPVEKIDPLTHFAGKKDSKFTTDEVVAIWNHAKKEYLDKDATYSEMVRGVSIDLGLSTKQVQAALAMPKGSKPINDEMYLTQRNRRNAINSAKAFVENAEIPKWKQFIPFSKTSIWASLFFQKAVFGHTGVGMQTHAGMNIYDPTQWRNYFGSYIQQFKNINKVQYEKSMEQLRNQPLYTKFLRAGLDIGPDKGYSEYEANQKLGVFGKAFKEIGEAGNRGFGALKTFRYAIAESYYNGLSAAEKADPNTIPNIVEMFNSATGVAETGLKSGTVASKIVSTALFAPKLIASRWNRLLVEPAKAIALLSKGNKMTPAETAQLKIYSKRVGTQLATMAGLLALNQAMLVATGQKERVNVTDPSKPDWMRFRWGNTALDLSGGMVGTAQFLARMLISIAPWTTQKDLKGKTRKEALEIAAGNYVFNTVSPVLSTVAEPVLRHDFNGNTVPWSNEKPLYPDAHKLTWKEYLWQQAPIPAAEAAKDMYQSMHDSGMSELQIGQIFTGVMKGVVAGGTGARVMELSDYSPNYNDKLSKPAADLLKDIPLQRFKATTNGDTGEQGATINGVFVKLNDEQVKKVDELTEKLVVEEIEKRMKSDYKGFEVDVENGGIKQVSDDVPTPPLTQKNLTKDMIQEQVNDIKKRNTEIAIMRLRIVSEDKLKGGESAKEEQQAHKHGVLTGTEK